MQHGRWRASEIAFWILALSCAFLFPSRFEGFGWPIVEAQALGCPVVCSSRAPFPEVAGDGALLRDVEDEQGFANDLVELVSDAKLRSNLIAKGRQNVLRYRPEAMISRYVALYERVLAEHGRAKDEASLANAPTHTSLAQQGAAAEGSS